MAPFPGTMLETSAANAVSGIWLVAPFIKEAPLRRLLAGVKSDVWITVVTRWHPAEVASGVSDLGCRNVVNSYQNSEFRLLPRLHAKYFRFDDAAYVGSANLTMRGLGWVTPSNLELLIKSDPIEQFESDIISHSVHATTEMQRLMEVAASQISPPPQLTYLEEPQSSSRDDLDYPRPWFPRFRSPGLLFEIQRGVDDFSHSQIAVGMRDLQQLEVPRCEEESQFNSAVAASLITQPMIAWMISFTTQPRRFGEVRRWVESLISPEEDSTLSTQVLYRWARYFLPEIFVIDRPGYSEIIQARV